jgi:hypothetical protein
MTAASGASMQQARAGPELRRCRARSEDYGRSALAVPSRSRRRAFLPRMVVHSSSLPRGGRRGWETLHRPIGRAQPRGEESAPQLTNPCAQGGVIWPVTDELKTKKFWWSRGGVCGPTRRSRGEEQMEARRWRRRQPVCATHQLGVLLGNITWRNGSSALSTP